MRLNRGQTFWNVLVVGTILIIAVIVWTAP